MTTLELLKEAKSILADSTSPLDLANRLALLAPEIDAGITKERRLRRSRRRRLAELAELALHTIQCDSGQCIDSAIAEFELVRKANSPKGVGAH